MEESLNRKYKQYRQQISKLLVELKLLQEQRLKAIGADLKARRRSLEMTQTDVAIMAGLTRSQLSNIENGGSGFSVKTLIGLCHALNATPNDLLGF